MKINSIGIFFLIILGGSILIIFEIYLITRESIKGYTDFLELSKTNEIGDAIGGIAGPLINLITAALLFLSFYEQRKANHLFMIQKSEEQISIFIKKMEDFDEELIEKYYQEIIDFIDECQQLKRLMDIPIPLRRTLNKYIYFLDSLSHFTKLSSNNMYLHLYYDRIDTLYELKFSTSLGNLEQPLRVFTSTTAKEGEGIFEKFSKLYVGISMLRSGIFSHYQLDWEGKS